MKHLLIAVFGLLLLPTSASAATEAVYVGQEPSGVFQVSPGNDVVLTTLNFNFNTTRAFGKAAYGKAVIREFYVRLSSAETESIGNKLSQVMLRNVSTGFSVNAEVETSGAKFVIYKFSNFIVGKDDKYVFRADVAKGITLMPLVLDICQSSQGNCATSWLGSKARREFIASADIAESGVQVGICMSGASVCPVKPASRVRPQQGGGMVLVETVQPKSLPKPQAGGKPVNVLSLKFSADCKEPINIRTITFVHSGTGKPSDIATAYLTTEDGIVISKPTTINPKDETLTLFIPNQLALPGCREKTINLYVAFSATAQIHRVHTFMVELGTDIETDATLVGGRFPIISRKLELLGTVSPIPGNGYLPAAQAQTLRSWYNEQLVRISRQCQPLDGEAERQCLARGRDQIRKEMRAKAKAE